jgi:hypothetical protein
MFSGQVLAIRRRGRASWRPRFTASAGALALAVLLSGNVAASQLSRDGGSEGPLVTPKSSSSDVATLLFRLKLATTAGYEVAVRG